MKQVQTEIIYNRQIADKIFELMIQTPADALNGFVPGQFAHIRIPGRKDLMMRRPLSVNSADIKANTATFVYQVVGEGTRELSVLKPKGILDAILPVGNGFILEKSHKNVWLAGGGMGVAPLRAVCETWPDRTYTAFLGFRSAANAYHLDAFRKACDKVYISSEDGSVGDKGMVTDMLEAYMKENTADILFACGPMPMVKALKDIAGSTGIPAYVSMEQRMGCGFGGCGVCACGIRHGDRVDYKRVCIDGPVFPLSEVVL